mmetsp:Transcript_102122/g.312349  ORF Transcript_102122/g.312349 Transcript_102122/m.312349 type:complete len:241 (+) Transcript_102122:847-1569(+)
MDRARCVASADHGRAPGSHQARRRRPAPGAGTPAGRPPRDRTRAHARGGGGLAPRRRETVAPDGPARRGRTGVPTCLVRRGGALGRQRPVDPASAAGPRGGVVGVGQVRRRVRAVRRSHEGFARGGRFVASGHPTHASVLRLGAQADRQVGGGGGGAPFSFGGMHAGLRPPSPRHLGGDEQLGRRLEGSGRPQRGGRLAPPQPRGVREGAWQEAPGHALVVQQPRRDVAVRREIRGGRAT